MPRIDPNQFRPERTLTGPQVAELAGVDHDLATRAFRALGFPYYPDDAVEFEESDVEALKTLKTLMDLGFSEEEIITLGRTFGHALSRVAGAEVRAFRENFVVPLESQGASPKEVLEQVSEAIPFLLELQQPLVDYTLRRHLAIAIESEVIAGRSSRTEVVAAGFVDMVGFSSMSTELDVEELGDLISTFETLCLETCADLGVQVVKIIGDAVMIVAPDPKAVLAASRSIICQLREEPDLPTARAGLDHGEALPLGGDYFGHPVNVAARLQEFARPDTIVVSESFVEAVGDGIEVSRIGTRRFHGVGPVRAFKVKLDD